MSIFDSLLKLYRSNSFKTPLEDFTTEILVYILNQDESIKSHFINDILQIEGSDFDITSQENYPSFDKDRSFCKIDIVIKNADTICFLENKVESKEGGLQLQTYSRILDGLTHYKNTKLRYCTKYYEHKAILEHDFFQLRWHNISNFLRRWEGKEMVQQFLMFLESNNMGNSIQFTIQDVLSLQHIGPLWGKMDTYLDKVKPSFNRCFGSFKNVNNMSHIYTHSRYVFIKENILGEGYSELGVGFEWKKHPKLLVWIWMNNKNTSLDDFKQLDLTGTDFYHNQNDYLEVSKPLSDFLSSDDMEKDIETWFINVFDKVKDLIANHPNLQWKVKISSRQMFRNL